MQTLCVVKRCTIILTSGFGVGGVFISMQCGLFASVEDIFFIVYQHTFLVMGVELFFT